MFVSNTSWHLMLTRRTYEFASHTSPDQDDDDDHKNDSNADSEADPLLFACGPCAHNRSVDLHISLLQVLVGVHGLLLDVLHHRLLLHNDGIQILEELLKLKHSPLNLLNGSVTLADVGQSTLSLAATVGVHERLLENLGIRTIGSRLLDLLLSRIRPNDEELSALLLLHILPELALDLLV